MYKSFITDVIVHGVARLKKLRDICGIIVNIKWYHVIYVAKKLLRNF